MTDDQHLGESDWEDQDLLTIEEAGERLELELSIASEELASARAAGDDPAADRLSARVQALGDALGRIRSTS